MKNGNGNDTSSHSTNGGTNGINGHPSLVSGLNVKHFLFELCEMTGVPFGGDNYFFLGEKILTALRKKQEQLDGYRDLVKDILGDDSDTVGTSSAKGKVNLLEDSATITVKDVASALNYAATGSSSSGGGGQSPEQDEVNGEKSSEGQGKGLSVRGSKGNFPCLCSERFETLARLISHIHMNNQSMQCGTCQHPFFLQCRFEQHKESCGKKMGATGISTPLKFNGNGVGSEQVVNFMTGVEVPPQNSSVVPPEELETEMDAGGDLDAGDLDAGDLDGQSQENDIGNISVEVAPPPPSHVLELQVGQEDINLELDPLINDANTVWVEPYPPESHDSSGTEIIDLVSDDDDDEEVNEQLINQALWADIDLNSSIQDNSNDKQSNGVTNGTQKKKDGPVDDVAAILKARAHHEPPNYGDSVGCVVCSKLFTNVKLLRIHLLEEHESDRKDVRCGLCGLMFASCKSFHTHRVLAHRVTDEKEDEKVGIPKNQNGGPPDDPSKKEDLPDNQNPSQNELNGDGGDQKEKRNTQKIQKRSRAEADVPSSPKIAKRGEQPDGGMNGKERPKRNRTSTWKLRKDD